MLIFLDKDGKRVSLDDPNAMIAEVRVMNEEFIDNAPLKRQKATLSDIWGKIDKETIEQLKAVILDIQEVFEEIEEALAVPEDVEIDEDAYYRIDDDETEYVPCPSRLYAAEYVTEPVFLPP